MHDLRAKEFSKKKKRFRFPFKLKWKYLLYVLLIIIILFPEQSGTFIGNWISDFFVTILDIIKNG